EQAKASQAQLEADTRIRKAEAEAEAKARAAQVEADRKIAEAQGAFLKMREDYRHDVTVKLDKLDKEIADLEAKAKTATGKAKVELDPNLKAIRESRAHSAHDFDALAHEAAVTWDAAKVRLDKEWDELKAMVDKS